MSQFRTNQRVQLTGEHPWAGKLGFYLRPGAARLHRLRVRLRTLRRPGRQAAGRVNLLPEAPPANAAVE